MASDLPNLPENGRQHSLFQGGSGWNPHKSHASHPSHESHETYATNGTDGTYETPRRSRKHGAVLALLLLVMVLRVLAAAQTTDQEWQLKAVQKYPQLGVQGSDLNQRFIAEFTKRKAANPEFFKDPTWPLLLADELAAPVATPTPAATPAPMPPPSTPAPKASRATFRTQWNAVSPANRLLAAFTVVLVIAAAGHAVARAITQRLRWTRIRVKADAYLSTLDGSNGIPSVPTQLALQTDERAFYCEASSLHEPRDTRRRRPAAGGFQLARGVWIAGSPNCSITQREWEKLDSGMITVTNQRVVFDGRSESVIIPIKRLDSVHAMGDSVELVITGRKKNMAFEAANPLILASIIHLSQGGHDARLRGAYIRDHPPAAAAPSRGNTGSSPSQSWQASSPPPPREAERPRPAPREPDPEPDHILHARTLGLSGSFGLADVKQKYHERMKEYHPDRVSGLGPKLREVAEVESKKINAAYEFFTKRFRATREA